MDVIAFGPGPRGMYEQGTVVCLGGPIFVV
jgi:hypothetical protein